MSAGGLSAETHRGSTQNGAEHPEIKTRADSRMSPLWLCPKLENCDQGSFIVKKGCFLATAELIHLVLPSGRGRGGNTVPGWKVAPSCSLNLSVCGYAFSSPALL